VCAGRAKSRDSPRNLDLLVWTLHRLESAARTSTVAEPEVAPSPVPLIVRVDIGFFISACSCFTQLRMLRWRAKSTSCRVRSLRGLFTGAPREGTGSREAPAASCSPHSGLNDGAQCKDDTSEFNDECLLLSFCKALELADCRASVAHFWLVISVLYRAGLECREVWHVMVMALCNARAREDLLVAMSPSERRMVVTIHTYLALCYCHDGHLPLRVWHEELFAGYCDLHQLLAAVNRLWALGDFHIAVSTSSLKQQAIHLGVPTLEADPWCA